MAPAGARPGPREYGTDAELGGDFGAAGRAIGASPLARGCIEPSADAAAAPLPGRAAGLATAAALGAAGRGGGAPGVSAARPALGRSLGAALPLRSGGSLEPVTAAYPHLRSA